MAERDARRKSASQVVAEKRIPRVAGGLLEIALGGGEIEFVETKREFKRGGERTDELGIGARSVAAQIVIDVHDADRQVPPGGKLEENVEEADGVGAAGDSDSNAIAGIEHAMALDGMDDSVEQDDFIVGPASGARHKSGAGCQPARRLATAAVSCTAYYRSSRNIRSLTTDKIQFTLYPGDQELQTPRSEAPL
jgi:hypothetical protein